jgi:hypothetical protein
MRDGTLEDIIYFFGEGGGGSKPPSANLAYNERYLALGGIFCRFLDLEHAYLENTIESSTIRSLKFGKHIYLGCS